MESYHRLDILSHSDIFLCFCFLFPERTMLRKIFLASSLWAFSFSNQLLIDVMREINILSCGCVVGYLPLIVWWEVMQADLDTILWWKMDVLHFITNVRFFLAQQYKASLHFFNFFFVDNSNPKTFDLWKHLVNTIFLFFSFIENNFKLKI